MRKTIFALSLILPALLIPLRVQAEEDLPYAFFPRSNEVFRGLIADPRQAQAIVRYYRSGGDNVGDVALGNTWGLVRWGNPRDPDGWTFQLGAEGMGYSRFVLSGGINEFQTIDFFLNLPLEIRKGRRHSARVAVFHESSHLGDDFIRRTGDTGYRFSVEGLSGVYAYEPSPHLRLYGGGSVLLHDIPKGQHGTLQSGFELRTSDLHWNWLPAHECWVYLAQDFQWKGRSSWNVNSQTLLGVRVGVKRVVRAVRMHLGYFEGHSEFGQFFALREHFFSLGMTFHF